MPGDLLIACGISGLTGRVLSVKVGPKIVDVTTDEGRAALGHVESCDIERPAPYRNVEEVMHAIVGGR